MYVSNSKFCCGESENLEFWRVTIIIIDILQNNFWKQWPGVPRYHSFISHSFMFQFLVSCKMTLFSETIITLTTDIPQLFMLWFIVYIYHMCCISTHHPHLSFIICWVWDHWSLTPFWTKGTLEKSDFLCHFVWIWSNFNSTEDNILAACLSLGTELAALNPYWNTMQDVH